MSVSSAPRAKSGPPKARHLKSGPPPFVQLYGRHAVAAALNNPRRKIKHIYADTSKQESLGAWLGAQLAEHPNPPPLAWVSRRALEKRVGEDALHQGLVADAKSLGNVTLDSLLEGLGTQARLVMLDQVTDPHNVGAIFRSAAVFGADAIVTTWRNSPEESGLLARVASGALDLVPWVRVNNLSVGLTQLESAGFESWGLAGEAQQTLGQAAAPNRLALVLGSEGEGLRAKTRETVTRLVRLETHGGPLQDLNVSNAAAVALHATQTSS